MSHADDGTLHAYLDGELTAGERAGLDVHLAECAACRTRLAEERDLVERARGLLARAAPPAAAVPPLRRTGGGAPGPRPLPRWVPLAWAASVLLALGGGWVARGGGAGGPEAPGSLALDRAEPASIVDSAGRGDVPAPVAIREDDAGAGSRAGQTAATASPARGAAAAKATAEEERMARIGAAAADEAGRMSAAPAAPVAQAAPRAAAVDLAAGVGVRDADAAATWTPVTADSARTILGAAPTTIPGLAVRRYGVSDRHEGIVLVEQVLEGTTVVQLYERRADAARNEAQQAVARERPSEAAGARSTSSSERLARYVGALRVEIAGPVTADSLSTLLERVR